MPPVSNPRVSIFDCGPTPPPELATEFVVLPEGAGPVQRFLFDEDVRHRASLKRKHRIDVERWRHESGGGPVEMDMYRVDAARAMERDPQRYVAALPPGVAAGPKSGKNRVVIY
jgi:hypothetical protein